MNTIKTAFDLDRKKLFAQERDENIVQSLLDTDFYKLTMLQFIMEKAQNVPTTFSWKNRSKHIQPHKYINIDELREQLNAVKNLNFSDSELQYLGGLNHKNSDEKIFSRKFLDNLKNLKLSEFDLNKNKDGSINLNFAGDWESTTLWEIHAMSIISEMYYNGLLKDKNVGEKKFREIYGNMRNRIMDSSQVLLGNEGLTFSEFGSRRRNTKEWHEQVYAYLRSEFPEFCVGTSNVALSQKFGTTPIGTNAHELPMVFANLTKNDTPEEILQSQYDVVNSWHDFYKGNLSIALGDTFGTTQFLKNVPEGFAKKLLGVRIDSMPPEQAIPLYNEWFRKNGVDPKTKIQIPSDGLTLTSAVDLYQKFFDQVGTLTFGIGTHLSNNSLGTAEGISKFSPISHVVKVTKANGMNTVKLSDNPEKAMGGKRAEEFKDIFGTDGMQTKKLEV